MPARSFRCRVVQARVSLGVRSSRTSPHSVPYALAIVVIYLQIIGCFVNGSSVSRATSSRGGRLARLTSRVAPRPCELPHALVCACRSVGLRAGRARRRERGEAAAALCLASAMAVFMLNVCKFNSCGLTFKSLGHLIQHIEETHIDYDPHVVERTEQQQPACIPLSYVLRFLSEGTRARLHASAAVGAAIQQPPQRAAAAATGSDEADESDSELLSEPSDSNDSWTTLEEFSSDFILRYGSRSSNTNVNSLCSKEEKPFACPVPGCKKRYKNVNGIKYHSKNGHKNDGKVRKAFKCPCGKSYKTPYGLKNHMSLRHPGTPQQQLQLQMLQHQQHQSRSKHSRLEPAESDSRLAAPSSRLAKIKVSAIQDHGYMKQQPERFDECDGLGVLTPASSPKAQDKYLYSSQAACSDN